MNFAQTSTHHTIIETAIEAAREAGALARQAFVEAGDGKRGHIEQKAGYHDIVTITDRQAESRASEIIFSRVPDSRILGEETGWRGEGGTTWYLDPIDGTSNFASGLPFFCVSIGAFDPSGAPLCGVVYDPMREEMFVSRDGQLVLNNTPITPSPLPSTDRDAELLTNAPHEGARPSDADLARFGDLVGTFRGVRRMGSCALQMAYVAAGRAALAYDEKFHSWDIAAGFQLVAAGGGTIRAWDGDGHDIADPMAALDAVKRFVIAGPDFDLSSSMILNHATGRVD
jgi:myo-inositol-1(or 4)-monophosphatase